MSGPTIATSARDVLLGEIRARTELMGELRAAERLSRELVDTLEQRERRIIELIEENQTLRRRAAGYQEGQNA